MAQKRSFASYLMLIGAMLIFGTIGIFRRYIALSSSLMAFCRGIMGSAFLVAFLKFKGRKVFHENNRKNLLLLCVSGGLMGANWIFLFEAYNNTTIATATLCYYMEPTIVMLLSPLFFKEKLPTRKIICIALSLVGMVLVSGIVESKGMEKGDSMGILLGLAAAALYASVVIINKKITVEDAYEKTVIQLFSAAVVLIPYLILTEDFSAVSLDGMGILMVLVVGLVHTGLAYALYFGSIQRLDVQSVAILSYIDPVSALILSGLFLGESLTVLGLLGAVLIIGSALMSEIRLGRK